MNNLYGQYIDIISKRYIKKGDKVFDCGCGNGFHTSILKKYSSKVIGGDFDNRIKKEYDIAFREIKINKYGKEKEFDLVTSLDVIEHVEDDLGYLKELIKITKSGGIMIVGTPNRKRLSNKITSLIKGKIEYPHKIGYHYESGGDIIHLREYTMDDLNNLVNKTKLVKIIENYSSFLGMYLPKIGPIGLKKIDVNFLKKYCQHLFIVLRKI